MATRTTNSSTQNRARSPFTQDLVSVATAPLSTVTQLQHHVHLQHGVSALEDVASCDMMPSSQKQDTSTVEDVASCDMMPREASDHRLEFDASCDMVPSSSYQQLSDLDVVGSMIPLGGAMESSDISQDAGSMGGFNGLLVEGPGVRTASMQVDAGVSLCIQQEQSARFGSEPGFSSRQQLSPLRQQAQAQPLQDFSSLTYHSLPLHNTQKTTAAAPMDFMSLARQYMPLEITQSQLTMGSAPMDFDSGLGSV